MDGEMFPQDIAKPMVGRNAPVDGPFDTKTRAADGSEEQWRA